jgi:hypothetical protein
MGMTGFVNPKDGSKPVHQVSNQYAWNFLQVWLLILWLLSINHSSKWFQRIREMTGGGVDYSIECVGDLEVLREAFLSTHDVSPKWHFIAIFSILFFFFFFFFCVWGCLCVTVKIKCILESICAHHPTTNACLWWYILTLYRDVSDSSPCIGKKDRFQPKNGKQN